MKESNVFFPVSFSVHLKQQNVAECLQCPTGFKVDFNSLIGRPFSTNYIVWFVNLQWK